MFLGLRTAGYYVGDLAGAKEWYTTVLGFPPYFDEPFYVGFSVGGFELGLVPDADRAGQGGAVPMWGVPDVNTAFARLQELGATPLDSPEDVGGDIKVASLIDPFGNVLGLIENPHFKPGDVR